MRKIITSLLAFSLLLISACNGGSTSSSSSSPPDVPSNVQITSGDSQLTVSWTESNNSSVTYNIYMSEDDPGITKENYVSKLNGMKHTNISNPFLHLGLANGHTYIFIVTAESSHGESGESEEVTGRPDSN